MTTSRPRRRASSSAPRATRRPDRSAREKTGTSTALAEHAQLLDRGGALEVGADEQRAAALLLSQRASLPTAVVFPEPCRPAIITTVGGFELIVSLPVSPPSVVDQLLVHDLDDLLAGLRLFATSAPTRALLDPVDERCGRRATLTSASSSARRISRQTSSMSRLGQPPAAAELVKMPSKRSESASNTGSRLVRPERV